MDDHFSLSEFLPYKLAHISERVSRRLAVEYESSHGLSMAEWRVLANLDDRGDASVRDIQLLTNLEKSRVSRAVSRLENAGLVSKHPNRIDARLLNIAITGKGRRVLGEIVPRAMELERALIDAIEDDEARTFFAILEKLHRALDKDPEARPRHDGLSDDSGTGGSAYIRTRAKSGS